MSKNIQKAGTKKGSVLILALGVLTVLVLLAATLTVITMLQSSSVSTFIDEKYAKEIAWNGLQSFIHEAKFNAIDLPVERDFVGDITKWSAYREEYGDKNFNLVYDEGEPLYRDNDLDDQYDTFSPLETNMTPGYMVDKANLPSKEYSDRVALVKGRDYDNMILVGISNFPKTTRSPGNEFSSIKSLPCASQVYINGPCSKKDVLDDNVIGMLNTLGDLLSKVYSKNGGDIAKDGESVELKKLGYLVAGLRYAGAFHTENDLKDKQRAESARSMKDNPFKAKVKIRELNATECDILRDFVTTAMWLDYTTLNPASITKGYGSNDTERVTPRGFAAKEIKNTGYDNEDVFAFQPPDKGADILAEDIPLPLRGWSSFKPVYDKVPFLSFYAWCFSTYTIRDTGTTSEDPYRTDVEEVSTKENEETVSLGGHLNQSANADDSAVKEPKDPQENPSMNSNFIQARAPVSINTAPREVLYAVLFPTWDEEHRGLSAVYINPDDRNICNPGIGVKSLPMDPQVVAQVVEKIMDYRRVKPFTTWRQFNKFLKDDCGDILSPEDRAMIRANANPNSSLADFNPDRNLGSAALSTQGLGEDGSRDMKFATAIDKDNLLSWSTEFCFSSMGYYEVESIGRVCEDLPEKELKKSNIKSGPVKRVISEKKLSAIICVYDVYKHSTQRDFETHSFQRVQGELYKIASHTTSPIMEDRFMNVASYPENMNNINLNRIPAEDKQGDDAIYAYEGAGLEEGKDTVSPSKGHLNGGSYDGYISVKSNDTDYKNGSRQSSIILAADYDKGFSAFGTKSGSGGIPRDPLVAEGSANDGRSLIDNAFEENNGDGTVGGSLTGSTDHNDGFFSHETMRYEYKYARTPAEEPYGNNLHQGIYDEYIRYASGVSGNENITESTDLSNVDGYFRPTGTVEMWFKPTWDLFDQFEGDLMTENVAKDSRVFFSLGTGKGVVQKSWTQVTGQRTIEYFDPQTNSTSVLYRNWPDPTWYTRVVEGPTDGGGTGPIIRETETVTRTDKTEQSSSQVIFFAGNRELNLFFSDNLEMNDTDPTGNFKSSSISLAYTPNQWSAGTWHHLAFVFDGTNSVGVFLDGIPSTNTYEPTSALQLSSEVQSMFIGSNRILQKSVVNGNPANADGTIDSLRIYNLPLASVGGSFPVPDRYDSKYDAFDEYFFQADIVDFSKYVADHKKPLSGIIGSVSWTEHMPIMSDNADIAVEILSNNMVFPEDPDDPKNGKDSKTYSADEDKDPYDDGSYCLVQKPVTFSSTEKVNTIRYKVKFKLPDPPDGLSFVTETPILDDITVTFITTPRIIANWEEPVFTGRRTKYNAAEINKAFGQTPIIHRDRKEKIGKKGDGFTDPRNGDTDSDPHPDTDTDSGDGSGNDTTVEDGGSDDGEHGDTDTDPNDDDGDGTGTGTGPIGPVGPTGPGGTGEGGGTEAGGGAGGGTGTDDQEDEIIDEEEPVVEDPPTGGGGGLPRPGWPGDPRPPIGGNPPDDPLEPPPIDPPPPPGDDGEGGGDNPPPDQPPPDHDSVILRETGIC